MNIDNDYSFVVTDDYGNDTICDTLAVVNVEGEKPMVIYTDYSLDEEDRFNLFASRVVEVDGTMQLEKIDDASNIPEIRQEMEKIWSEMNSDDTSKQG